MSNISSGLNIKQSCFRQRRATNETGVGGDSVGRGGFDLVDFDPVVKKDSTFGREGVGAENIARIANAVQVTICLLVSTSVF